MFEKLMEFARTGKGRRLLNTLNKRDMVLADDELNQILKVYCETGLPLEVERLKERRGILNEAQYNALADEVRRNGCIERYDQFALSLRNLLSCDMKMNPARMIPEEPD